MISIEARKFLLKLILVFLSTDYANSTNGCESNKKLYTEIGCKPIYGNDSSSCAVAYDCETVFARPNDKCHFNGNVYEPQTGLSETDSKLSPCLAGCSCRQNTHNNKTTTKFNCAHVECPSLFTSYPMEPCYYQYNVDSCCEVDKFCPEEKSFVHECSFDGKTYKNGQRFYISDYLECVCSPEFNGTASDTSCRKVGCNYEILYMENILKRNAPVYFEGVDGCPMHWYQSEYDVATAEGTVTSKSNSHGCKYGDLSLSLGQKLILSPQDDSDYYTTTCSCNTPPLVTCVKFRKERPITHLNITKID